MKRHLILLLVILCSSIWAQEFRGTILGRVQDSSQAVVVGATVTVTNTATNVWVTTSF